MTGQGQVNDKQGIGGVSLDITDRMRADQMRRGLVELSDAFHDLDDSADLSFTPGRILGEALDVDRAGYGIVDPDAKTITIERDWNAPGSRACPARSISATMAPTSRTQCAGVA